MDNIITNVDVITGEITTITKAYTPEEIASIEAGLLEIEKNKPTVNSLQAQIAQIQAQIDALQGV
jgi:hypothetical protein